jgi:phage terminase large subunit GpA-like protein
MTQTQILESDINFLTSCFDGLTAERIYQLPSEYIESVRYLPKELTPKPGYYDYNFTPPLREIVDCFSPMSPVREIVFMKGLQIGATTGILEAALAYHIGSVPTPQLYVSADKELVTMGMKTKVERMLDNCGLREKIMSQSDLGNKRKTGDTQTEKEYPGGFLHAIGARNPGKLRSMSYPVILFDELDGFPDRLGDEGDPVDLARNRSVAFSRKRKLLYVSTPLVLQTSKIYKLFMSGDQRYFNIPCKHCGQMITLEWHLNESQTQTGLKAGIMFDFLESGNIIPESVHYKTQCCGKKIYDHDKTIFMPEGQWIPTATPYYEGIRSYQENTLYSAPGFFSWTDMVYEWSKCWDVIKNRVRDVEKYREFRNTKQGLPYEERGEAPRYERVVAHRRNYPANSINNKQAIEETGSPVLLLTCAVDVQKECLFCHIIAWCRNGVNYTLDFRTLEGDTELITSESWKQLENIIENEVWVSDDKKQYRIRATEIDAGYRSEQVYNFCSQYSSGVYPSFGRDYLQDGVTFRLASKSTLDKAGTLVYLVNTTKLKDRIAASFRRDWNTGELQPEWHPNFPEDFRDDLFRQYEAESKVNVMDKRTNKIQRIIWKADAGADNHLFDTTGYNHNILEVIADNICRIELGLDSLSWPDFWKFAEEGGYYTI